jgi:DNA-directed RNA polymerase subunit omega
MLFPAIDELMKKVDSKYSLVAAASKRARMLSGGQTSELIKPNSYKNVGVALEEIYHDMIQLEQVPEKSSLEEENN